MTRQLASLQHELDQWEHDVAALKDDLTAGELNLPEQLMATVQDTLTAYRRRILPRLAFGPGPAESEQAGNAAEYDMILAGEFSHALTRLEGVRRELVAGRPTPELQTQLSENLAVLRVLTRIALRRNRT